MATIGMSLALSIGGAVGIVLTGAYLWWEMGRYATPQVAENRFDERRMIFAYTLGLFVGILLVIPWDLFLLEMGIGNLLFAVFFLVALVLITELVQRLIRRTAYWGKGPSFPFYAVGLRAGIGAILILALVGPYLSSPVITWDGVTVVVLQSLAILAVEVTGALLSFPTPATAGHRPGGGLFHASLISAIGFFLLGFNALGGEVVGSVAAGIALLGSLYLYRRLRGIFDRVPPPSLAGAATPVPSTGRYARKDRGPPPR